MSKNSFSGGIILDPKLLKCKHCEYVMYRSPIAITTHYHTKHKQFSNIEVAKLYGFYKDYPKL